MPVSRETFVKTPYVMQVLTAVERHVNWETVKCLVIAGPGFVKDDFKKHMDAEAVRRDLR